MAVKTYLFWANVRTYDNHGQRQRQLSGSFMQVQIRAPNSWQAKQMLLAQYGKDDLVSEAALVSGSEKEGW